MNNYVQNETKTTKIYCSIISQKVMCPVSAASSVGNITEMTVLQKVN